MFSSSKKTHPELLAVEGLDFPIRVRINRRAKRLILKVEPTDGQVTLVSPSKHALKQAKTFVAKERQWIKTKLDRLPEGITFAPGTCLTVHGQEVTLTHAPDAKRGVWLDEPNGALMVSGDLAFFSRRVTDYLKRSARTVFGELTTHYTKVLDLPPVKITVRDPKTRWGSCSQSGTLSFSWRLILAPRNVMDYVAAHECTHLIHLNHSRKFWSKLGEIFPGYQEADDWLSLHGSELHRFGRAEKSVSGEETSYIIK